MPNPNGSQPAIIFLHIPKAGGSTLHTILGRQYGPRNTFVVGTQVRASLRAFTELPEQERARLRVVRGHMGFGLHAHLPQPCTYITLLRDPVERAISSYYYILRTPEHTHHAALTSRGLTLREFVEQGISKAAVDNGQTRLLSGAADLGDQIGFRQCTRGLLEQAKANLRDYFTVAGLTEAFDAALLLLQDAFHWKSIYYVRQNVTRNRLKRSAADAETLALIREYNALDLELYRYARERFFEQLRLRGGAFAARLVMFRWLNQLYNWRAARRARA